MVDQRLVKKTVEWRLPVLMAEAGIRTAIELHRQLVELGVEISADRISRIRYKMPDRINADVLVGLMTVLNCSASDLIREVPHRDTGKSETTSTDRPMRDVERIDSRKTRDGSGGAGPADIAALAEAAGSMASTKVRAFPVKPRR